MPTGYTSILEEPGGCTFETYLLRCARAFGACVMQRDDDMDDPPKFREPSDYHLKEIERGMARRRELASMTPEQACHMWRADVERIEKANAEYCAEWARLNRVYAEMREKVEAWTPPTPDHEVLKKFMLQQIHVSREFCDEPYHAQAPLSADDWLRQQMDAIDLSYHVKKYAEEVDQCSKANAWTKALYESLPSRKGT
jgi:hypothetical protein